MVFTDQIRLAHAACKTQCNTRSAAVEPDERQSAPGEVALVKTGVADWPGSGQTSTLVHARQACDV